MKLQDLYVVQMLTGRWGAWDTFRVNWPGRVIDVCVAWATAGYQLAEAFGWWGLLLWPLALLWALVWMLVLVPVWMPCIVLSIGLDVWRGV